MTMPQGKQGQAGPLSKAVAAEVRAVLARTRTHASKLSEDMGVSTSYISNRLRDKYPFTLNDVEAISRALKLDLVEFISAAAQHATDER